MPLKAVNMVAKYLHCTNQIVTTLLPRPEYGWSTIINWFPEKRVWVIPDAGEAFDDVKSIFFESRGDSVVRIKESSKITGRDLRDYYKKGDHTSFKKYVPEFVDKIYWKEEIDENALKDFQKRADAFEINSRWVTSDEINTVPFRYLSSRATLGELLDAGGGTGFLAYFLSNRLPYNTISVVDISKNMLDKVHEKMSDAKTFNDSIELFCKMIDRQFDTILVRQVLHYVDNVNSVISLLRSVLKDNGVLYVGQILVNDGECREWHDELMQEISKSRKRTFIYDEFLELFHQGGFEIIEHSTTDFKENLRDFYKRRVNRDIEFEYLKTKMENLLNKSTKLKLDVKTSSDNLEFTVKFCHVLLRKVV